MCWPCGRWVLDFQLWLSTLCPLRQDELTPQQRSGHDSSCSFSHVVEGFCAWEKVGLETPVLKEWRVTVCHGRWWFVLGLKHRGGLKMSLSCLVEIKVLKAAEVQSGALIPTSVQCLWGTGVLWALISVVKELGEGDLHFTLPFCNVND